MIIEVSDSQPLKVSSGIVVTPDDNVTVFSNVQIEKAFVPIVTLLVIVTDTILVQPKKA